MFKETFLWVVMVIVVLELINVAAYLANTPSTISLVCSIGIVFLTIVGAVHFVFWRLVK